MADEAADTVREWFGRLAAGDPGVDLCAPDIRIDNLSEFPITGPYLGHDGVRQWWSDLVDAIDDLRIELDEVEQLDEERVLSTQRIVGRFRHTGISLDAGWASVVSVRAGRIVRAVGYGSRRRALRESEK